MFDFSAVSSGNSQGAGSLAFFRCEATINAPGGRFADHGVANTFVLTPAPGSGTGTLHESLISDLTATSASPFPWKEHFEDCASGGTPGGRFVACCLDSGCR